MCDWSWVPCEDGKVPGDALEAGVDKDGGRIFVGRALHEGEYVPAKVIPNHNVAYISFDGAEIGKDSYQVLRPGSCTPLWKRCTGGDIPCNAMTAGRKNSCSEPLYIGRVFHDGTMTVGKVHPSHGCCYIPYDGEELNFNTYEALILE